MSLKWSYNAGPFQGGAEGMIPEGGQGIASNLARSPIFESWCDVLTNGKQMLGSSSSVSGRAETPNGLL